MNKTAQNMRNVDENQLNYAWQGLLFLFAVIIPQVRFVHTRVLQAF